MIKAAIYGYGNLGRGVECAVTDAPDMELTGIFTRRDPESITAASGAKVYSASELERFRDRIDVLILCGGSATDLPEMTPSAASLFHVVDSFDTHAKIPEHFARVDEAARKAGTVAIISGGWDPGLFSLIRVCSEAVLPRGESYTFWGRGVSQGHSDAIRRIPGVADARQYTIPVKKAVELAESGTMPSLTVRQKHTRECFVVAEEEADREKIRQAIVTMPDYFADYDTTVEFITAEEMQRDHRGLPHGGHVIRTGRTGLNGECSETVKFSLKLESNPQFTGAVLTALARAAVRLSQKGETGCRTILDIPPALLSVHSPEELRRAFL